MFMMMMMMISLKKFVLYRYCAIGNIDMPVFDIVANCGDPCMRVGAASVMSACKGLDFGRGILERYGWKEGEGLGLNKDGIVKPLKTKLKLDKAGFGHQGEYEYLTSKWWEVAYNKAANKITIQDGAAVLTKVDLEKTQTNRDIGKNKGTTSATVKKLTDEEIFQVCAGRTVHKGARHGIKQNGKLARIQRQEQLLQTIHGSCSKGQKTEKTVSEKDEVKYLSAVQEETEEETQKCIVSFKERRMNESLIDNGLYEPCSQELQNNRSVGSDFSKKKKTKKNKFKQKINEGSIDTTGYYPKPKKCKKKNDVAINE